MDGWVLNRIKYKNPSEFILRTSIGKYVVGRAETCDFTCASTYVSRNHSNIFYDDQELKWKIIDTKSMNGTYVNGEQLQMYIPQVLNIGDKIGFGISAVTDEKCHIYIINLPLQEGNDEINDLQNSRDKCQVNQIEVKIKTETTTNSSISGSDNSTKTVPRTQTLQSPNCPVRTSVIVAPGKGQTSRASQSTCGLSVDKVETIKAEDNPEDNFKSSVRSTENYENSEMEIFYVPTGVVGLKNVESDKTVNTSESYENICSDEDFDIIPKVEPNLETMDVGQGKLCNTSNPITSCILECGTIKFQAKLQTKDLGQGKLYNISNPTAYKKESILNCGATSSSPKMKRVSDNFVRCATKAIENVWGISKEKPGRHTTMAKSVIPESETSEGREIEVVNISSDTDSDESTNCSNRETNSASRKTEIENKQKISACAETTKLETSMIYDSSLSSTDCKRKKSSTGSSKRNKSDSTESNLSTERKSCNSISENKSESSFISQENLNTSNTLKTTLGSRHVQCSSDDTSSKIDLVTKTKEKVEEKLLEKLESTEIYQTLKFQSKTKYVPNSCPNLSKSTDNDVRPESQKDKKINCTGTDTKKSRCTEASLDALVTSDLNMCITNLTSDLNPVVRLKRLDVTAVKRLQKPTNIKDRDNCKSEAKEHNLSNSENMKQVKTTCVSNKISSVMVSESTFNLNRTKETVKTNTTATVTVNHEKLNHLLPGIKSKTESTLHKSENRLKTESVQKSKLEHPNSTTEAATCKTSVKVNSISNAITTDISTVPKYITEKSKLSVGKLRTTSESHNSITSCPKMKPSVNNKTVPEQGNLYIQHTHVDVPGSSNAPSGKVVQTTSHANDGKTKISCSKFSLEDLESTGKIVESVGPHIFTNWSNTNTTDSVVPNNASDSVNTIEIAKHTDSKKVYRTCHKFKETNRHKKGLPISRKKKPICDDDEVIVIGSDSESLGLSDLSEIEDSVTFKTEDKVESPTPHEYSQGDMVIYLDDSEENNEHVLQSTAKQEDFEDDLDYDQCDIQSSNSAITDLTCSDSEDDEWLHKLSQGMKVETDVSEQTMSKENQSELNLQDDAWDLLNELPELNNEFETAAADGLEIVSDEEFPTDHSASPKNLPLTGNDVTDSGKRDSSAVFVDKNTNDWWPEFSQYDFDDIEEQEKDVTKKKDNSSARTVQMIDALPMPSRRANQRGISEEEVQKLVEKKMKEANKATECKQTSPPTVPVKSFYSKDEKLSAQTTTSKGKLVISKRSKPVHKSVAERRKSRESTRKKVKSLYNQKGENSTVIKPVTTATVKVKVTKKNRGAFLTEVDIFEGTGVRSTEGKEDKCSEKYLKKVESIKKQTVTSSREHYCIGSLDFITKQLDTSKKIPKISRQNSKDTSPTSGKCDSVTTFNTSGDTALLSNNDTPCVPKSKPFAKDIVSSLISVVTSSNDYNNTPEPMDIDIENDDSNETDNKSESMDTEIQITLPSTGILKKGDAISVKKTVRFDENQNQVHVIEPRVTKSRLSYGCKDVPLENNLRLKDVLRKTNRIVTLIPCNKVGNPAPNLEGQTIARRATALSMDEVYADILSWNYLWLREQNAFPLNKPPPVYGGRKLYPTLTTYKCFEDYYKNMYPLLLLELWARLTKEFNYKAERNTLTAKWGLDIDSTGIIDVPSTGRRTQIIHCRLVVDTKHLSHPDLPKSGDFVLVQRPIQKQNKGATSGYQTFGFIENSSKEVNGRGLTGQSDTGTVTYELRVKFSDIQFKPTLSVKVLSSIRSDLRTFEALVILRQSPLCKDILMPSKLSCALPPPKGNIVSKYELNNIQQETILSISQSCLVQKNIPKISLVQGPPGTGKSHFIVALAMQLVGDSEVLNNPLRQKPRLLLCAPSNAALDELVLRLLEERSKFESKHRFNMVRMGVKGKMHPRVTEISLDYITKNTAMATLKSNNDSLDSDSLELEVMTIQAKINSLKMKEDTLIQKNEMLQVGLVRRKIAEYEQRKKNFEKSNGVVTIISPQLEHSSRMRVLDGADIIATTLSSCVTMNMKQLFKKNSRPFTCCILDESSQCTEMETLIPLMLGITKLILVGDPYQLPATVMSQTAQQLGLDQSLFFRLDRYFQEDPENPIIMLNVQYRMHHSISQHPSNVFYQHKLLTSPMIDRKSPFHPYKILDLKEGMEHSSQGSFGNSLEAELVVKLTLSVLDILISRKMSLGIITPYQKQKVHLQERMNKYRSNMEKCRIEINTVDSYQGKEMDVIILSCVRGQSNKTNNKIGFLSNPQRLNVAITRARFALFICGNMSAFQGNPTWSDLIRDARNRGIMTSIRPEMVQDKQALRKIITI